MLIRILTTVMLCQVALGGALMAVEGRSQTVKPDSASYRWFGVTYLVIGVWLALAQW